MKSFIATAIVLAIISVVAIRADEAALSVSLVIPQDHGERRVTYRNSRSEWDRGAHFHVVVSNRSDKPQNIWKEEVSWGYWALSFEFTDDTGKQWVVKKRGNKPFTANRPVHWILEPNENFVYEVYFSDTNIWEDFPRPDEGSKVLVSMRAIFEIHPKPFLAPISGPTSPSVWTGRVVSEPRRITFYRPK
jgi:hypothetical protein